MRQAPRVDACPSTGRGAGSFASRQRRQDQLKLSIDLTREVLGVPADYRIGITPGSDTGAVEMALWTMLGARGVDVLAWESFGDGWVTDVVKQLKIKDARTLKAPYGELPDLGACISTMTSSSPGTARRPVSACRMRLDCRRSQGSDDLRCDLRRLRARPRLVEAGCRHVLLAESSWAARPRTA